MSDEFTAGVDPEMGRIVVVTEQGRDAGRILVKTACARCGANTLERGAGALGAGEMLVFRDGKWRRPA